MTSEFNQNLVNEITWYDYWIQSKLFNQNLVKSIGMTSEFNQNLVNEIAWYDYWIQLKFSGITSYD
jgi:hypothetical protein